MTQAKDYRAARWDASAQRRFWRNVDATAGPESCWLWSGTLNSAGYGILTLGKGRYRAHRLLKAKVDQHFRDDLVCDHLCRNRACVNPAHIEMVSSGENVKRGIGVEVARALKAKITHCIRGHEFSPQNTYITTVGKRSCRKCGTVFTNRCRAKKRAARTDLDTRAKGKTFKLPAKLNTARHYAGGE